MASSAVARETFLALRREIARIEGRLADRLEMPSDSGVAKPSPAFTDGTILRRGGETQRKAIHIATGVERLDACLGGGLPRAALTEFHGTETRNAGAVAGFVASLLALLLKSFFQADPVLWVSLTSFFREAGRPYAPGLSQRFGIAHQSLIFAETCKVEEALWLAEEAAVIGRFAATILELPGNPVRLDLTATRRLHRRAMLTGRPIFLLRQSARPEPTAASVRFVIGPAPAGQRKSLLGSLRGSIGPPAFTVSVEKSPTARNDDFILELSTDGFLFERPRQGTKDHGAMVPQPRRAAGAAPTAGAILAFDPLAASTIGGQPSRGKRAENLRAG